MHIHTYIPFSIYSGASVTYTASGRPGRAGNTAASADVAIVFLSASAREGEDRESLSLSPDQVSKKGASYLD